MEFAISTLNEQWRNVMDFDYEEFCTDISEANSSQIKKYAGIGLLISVVLMFLCPLLLPFAVFALAWLAGLATQKNDEAEREKLRQQRARREQAADIAHQRRKPVRSENSSPTRLMKKKVPR